MNSRVSVADAASLTEFAKAVAGSSWDDLEGDDVVAAVEAVVTARSYLDAALLRGIDRLETGDGLRELGWATTKDWLTHVTGGLKGTGGGLVRAVEQLRDLSAVQAALEEGRVSLPQARAIASKVQKLPRVAGFRTAVADAMLDLVDHHGHDASDLHAAFDEVVRDLDPDGEFIDTERERDQAERGAHHNRHLSLVDDQYGGVKLRGYGTVEDAERIKAALLPLAAPVTTQAGACGGRRRSPDEPIFDDHGDSTQIPCLTPGCGHDGRDPREAGARMWDALVDACDRLRATDSLPRDHGSTPRVVVLIDRESLEQEVIDAGHARSGDTPTGHELSASTTRRLACDAEIIPAVLGGQGQVLDVGRAQRLVTYAIWMALVVRDRHCAFPGCRRMPLACDAHHVTHWADGGTTSLDNLVMLCRHHHTVVHHTPWAVRVDPHTRLPVWTMPPRLNLANLERRTGYRHRYPPPKQSGTLPPSAA